MKPTQLPPNWRQVHLSSVADVQTGLALGKQAKADPVRLPYLRVANVQDGFLDLTEIKEVVIERSQIARYALRAGDVLLTEGGDFDKLGRGHIWNNEIPGCIHQNHIFVVRPHAELASSFLAILTSSDYGRAYFQSCSKKSTNLASINSSQLKAFPVLLPGIQQQLTISALLSTWDRGIRQLSELITAKRRFKQGLMQQLLTGQRRHQEFVVSRDFHSSSIGCSTYDWPLRQLRDLTEDVRRRNGTGVDRRVLTASGNRGLIDQQDYFNRSVAGKSLEGYYLLKQGEFAYNRSLMKGYPYGAIKRLDDYSEGVVSTLYLCFKISSDECDSNWFVHLCEAGILNAQLRGIAKMGARAHGLLNVKSSEFYAMAIPLPPRPEQEKIASILDAADREIDLLRKQREALKQQKKGLMQKLLTGEVHLKEIADAQ